jgi:adenosine deaminase
LTTPEHTLDLAALPKVDLHRHLEGSIRPATAIALGQQSGAFAPTLTLAELRGRAVIQEPVDLFEALDRFDLLRRPIQGFAAVERIARECIEDAAADGIICANLRFSPTTLAKSAKLTVQDVFRAVQQGVESALAERPEVAVEVLAIISRRRGVEAAWDVVRELENDANRVVMGVDFASDELRHRTVEFTEVARALSQLGLPLTVHTGEGTDASAVAESLALPGVRRLGHALSLPTDPGLMREVVARGIVVEISLTSNVRTRTVDSYRSHPARAMAEAGVALAFCTDDPALFDIDLTHELKVARDQLGLTDADLVRAQAAARAAFFGELPR